MLKGSEQWCQTAEQAARRETFGRAARSELALRNGLEQFCRSRWPDARICHEMVMGERRVRADVVAIGTDHIAAFEVKGNYDDTVRLLHQVGMYQLCCPEVWMVVSARHGDDARLIRHLIPSIGLLTGSGKTIAGSGWDEDYSGDIALTVEAEAVPRPVAPIAMLEMMWANELMAMCDALGVARGKRPRRSGMIKDLLDLPINELQRACCTELRARDALWRADSPIRAAVNGE